MLPIIAIIIIAGVLVFAGYLAFKGKQNKLGERDPE